MESSSLMKTTSLDVAEDLILVRNSPFPLKDVLKALPGSWWESKFTAWTFPAVPHIAVKVREILPGVPRTTSFA